VPSSAEPGTATSCPGAWMRPWAFFRGIPRWSTICAAVVISVVGNVLVWRGSEPAWLGGVVLESLTPLVFVPVFAGVYLEDRRLGTHELLLALPRCRGVYARRLALPAWVAALVIVGESVAWHARSGFAFGWGVLAAAAPVAVLGALAFLTALASGSETAAIGLPVGLWTLEQVPGVAQLMSSPPLYYLYLCPLTRNPAGPMLINKLVMLGAAAALIAASFALIGRPERLLKG
jgi:hypothetical protein